ncbi:HWE histidine kinase domain-containing protein [Marinibacterium sp. SX1]|uniref:HWE histidine kinase domain-containing protein n=1 Tax=Marinibacterium sp. SX1 TaxID=3388424 RepID=UPI003D16D419
MSSHTDTDRTSAGAQAVDLTNCDREPIHIIGQVQPFGMLMAVSADWIVAHASANIGDLLGRGPDDIIGQSMIDLMPPRTVHDLRSRLQMLTHDDAVARLFGLDVAGDGVAHDVSIHRSGRLYIFEFERSAPRTDRHGDDNEMVRALIGRIQRHDDIDRMAREAARGLKALTEFRRVMVYRFNEDDTGTVIAEALDPGQTPYLGLRFPGSDIPRQARALYARNLLRIIADVNGETVPVLPALGPSGDPLDLSLSATRAVSPIHLEYLRNMGVGASMSVSILSKGKLWGLLACHHDAPHYVDYQTRSAAELFAQLFSYELTQMEMNTELAEMDLAREMHDRLLSQMTSTPDVLDNLDTIARAVEEVVEFDGLAVYSHGRYRAMGSAPTEEEFMGLARFLNTTQVSSVFATDRITERYPAGDGFVERAAGLLALPISRQPRDYIVLFRREIARSVSWAGDPLKPAEPGPNGLRLTPRKSFEAWQEVVRGSSAPWRLSERRAAEALRVTLLEIVLKLSDEANLARKRSQEQQELLIAELNHRVRNILNLIQGLVSQGRGDATTIEAYSDVLNARIHSLARAHDQLTRKSWAWVPLAHLVETEARAYLSGQADRVRQTGDAIDLSPQAFTTMALVIHELMTNSAKYGALSDSTGRVELKVTLDRDGAAVLDWRERGGPPVKPPKRRGFGTTIIERSVPFELKGEASVDFRVGGLRAHFRLPATAVQRAEVTPPETPGPETTRPVAEVTLAGEALVVEDNLIIALDASDGLGLLGASAVHSAPSVVEAIEILDRRPIRFALIDVNLGEDSSLPVAEACAARGIPFAMATGYGENADLLADYPPAPVLRKPYDVDHIRALLAELDAAGKLLGDPDDGPGGA